MDDDAHDGAKLTFLDRAIEAVAPTWGMERRLARGALKEFSSGVGGSPRGRNASRYEQGSSESWMKQRKRLDAIWESRAMEENFCIITGILERLAMYVVGHLEYQAQTGNSKADAEINDFFHGWCERCDMSGRFRLRQLAELGLRAMWREGEHGWIEHIEDDELRLQPIESDRIGNPMIIQYNETNIGGIEIDPATGRVKHYEIWHRSRIGTYRKEGDVLPENFIHLFRPTRADQYHGVSALAPVLPHARDLYELFGFEKVAAKFAASWAGFVRTKAPFGKGSLGWDKRDANGNPTFAARPGAIARIDESESIEFAPGVTRPSGAFMALVDAMIREIAIGLNLPYGFIYNMASFGGVTARLELQQAQRVFRRYQEMLVQTLLERVKRKVLNLAVASGKIRAVKNFQRGSWQFGAAITGDIGYQTQADATLVQYGAKTATEWAAELGGNYAANLHTKASEIEEAMAISKAKGIPLELLVQNYPNPTELIANLEKAKTGADLPPPPPPGLIGAAGDKAAAGVVNLLASIGRGEIDRESGRNTLVTVYGMAPADALAVLPG